MTFPKATRTVVRRRPPRLPFIASQKCELSALPIAFHPRQKSASTIRLYWRKTFISNAGPAWYGGCCIKSETFSVLHDRDSFFAFGIYTMGCPFYGKNEDLCDVGCGYISPHDAKVISQFCSTQPEECPRYQYLMERSPDRKTPPAPRLAPAIPTPSPWAEAPCPVTDPEQVPPASSRPPQTRPFSPLPPLGLLCFGLTTLIFSLYLTALLPLPEWLFDFAILAGGLGQFTVGVLEWSRKRWFSSVALCAYGFFWLSLPLLLPATSAAGAPALTAYLLLWCLFGAVLLIASLQINRALPWVFGTSSLLLFLLAAGHATGYRPIEIAALLTGFACAATALRAVRNPSAAIAGKDPSRSPFHTRPADFRRN